MKRIVMSAAFLLAASLCNAQGVNGVQCIANSGVPPTLRSEGLNEVVGDILLNCSGGVPAQPGSRIPQANITVFLNTNVTSRLLNSTGASEALLMVDEPGSAPSQSVPSPAPQFVCPNIFGCATVAPAAGTSPYSGTPSDPNVFQGVVSGNSVTFNGIPIMPPETTGHRIFRITNVRANANLLPPGNATAPGQVIALISSAPAANGSTPGAVLDITNPSQTVGRVQPSLQASVQGQSLIQCPGVNGGQPYNQGTPTQPATALVRYGELFPGAFKRKNLAQDSTHIDVNGAPTVIGQNTVSTESGTILNPAANGNPLIGQAGRGTPLFLQFSNIPQGMSVYTYSQIPMFLAGGTIPVGYAATSGGTAAPSNPLFFDRAFTPAPGSNSVTINLDVVDTVDQATTAKTLNAQVGFFGPTQTFPANIMVSGGFRAASDPTVVQNFAQSSSLLIPQFVTGASYANPLQAQPSYLVATIRGCPDGPATLTSTQSNPSADFTGAPGGPTFPGYIIIPLFSSGAPTSNISASLVPPSSSVNVTVDQTTTPANIILRPIVRSGPGSVATSLVVSSSSGAFTAPVNFNTTGNPFIGPWAMDNVASYLSGGVSPGEVIVGFANNEFGPASPQLATLNSSSQLSNQIGDTQLQFDGNLAPLYYLYDNAGIKQGQIAAFVPNSVQGKSQTVIQVVRNGVPGPGITVPVLDATPGLSTADSSGKGPLAALNHDGSVNTADNPETQGQIIQLFGTGFGETTPPIRDGFFNGIGAPLGTLNLPITAFVNGTQLPQASLIYTGPAPGAPEGVSQFNIRTPTGLVPGPVFMELQAGDKGSRPGTTIFVK